MGWGRVVQLTSSSSRLVHGGLWKCPMATRSSQRRARSRFELPRAFGEYLTPTLSPASTYMYVLLPQNETVMCCYASFFKLCVALGSVQPRVPCRGNSGSGPERARPRPDWWRWNGRRSKGDQSTVRRIWTLGPQRTNHYNQHVVVGALQTSECQTAEVKGPLFQQKPRQCCVWWGLQIKYEQWFSNLDTCLSDCGFVHRATG